jgi:hypothetical protein
VNAGFAERLLEVIDSGRRTATYKLAVLLAMLDLCARRSDTRGRAPRVLYTRDIAEQVASLYWPQVIPYLVPGAASAEVLRQISLPRAAIVAAVSSFRSAAKAAGATSWQLARPRLPGAYRTRLDQVEVIVAEQPLPRLQAAGSAQAVFPFLYELSWGPRESFSVARLRRHGPRGLAVDLLPGAGDELLRLGPLIRPLIEVHWTRMVAEINGVASAELNLHRHLFGSDRTLPPRPLRDGIAALQDGRCFYCHDPLGSTPWADHFIPRIRCGTDAVETWSWPTGGATTTSATCSPARARHGLGPPQPALRHRSHRPGHRRPVGLRPGRDHSRGPLDLQPPAPSRHPLWLGYKDVAAADPAMAIAALNQ